MQSPKNPERSPFNPTHVAHSFLDHLSHFSKEGRFGDTVFICLIAEVDKDGNKGRVRVVEHGHDSLKAKVLNTYLDHKIKVS